MEAGKDVPGALAAEVEHLAAGQLLGDDRERRPLGLEHGHLPAVAVDRHLDPGEPAYVPSPGAGGVHDGPAVDVVVVRRDADHAPSGDPDGQ